MAIKPIRDDEDDDDLKKKMPDFQAQLEKLIHDSIEMIAALNTEYNKYFTGVERQPPVKQRDVLEKMVLQIKNLKRHANTQALTFKIQNVTNSFMSYKTLWDKKLSDIESGKFVIPKKGR